MSAPDIKLVMAYEMGFYDIGCYAGRIHTPTFDRLAENRAGSRSSITAREDISD